MARKALPPQQVLHQLFDYNPATGALIWKPRPENPKFNARFAGRPAFTTVERGYRQGRIFGELHYAHRIIWRLMTGDIADDIDHINGNRADNSFANLRNVNRQENLRNRKLGPRNSSGFHGVYRAYWGAWQAYIGVGNKAKCLGAFKTLEEAVTARKEAEKRLGYHENHGRAAWRVLPGMPAPGDPVAVGDRIRTMIARDLSTT